jgi:Uma2 family endonuclease
MTSALAAPAPLDFDHFLGLYGERDVRCELFEGEVFLMAGGSPSHSLLSLNAAFALKARFAPLGCTTYGSDVYLRRADDASNAMLPDAFVRCGPPLPKDQRFVGDPVIIVEVLSPSTMEYDRGEKLVRYTKIDSVQHIMLVYQDEHRVEVLSRPPPERWSKHEGMQTVWDRQVVSGLSGTVLLGGFDMTLAMAELYDGVDIAAA